jgi:acyl-CoA synthetase (AMP-forming)/AMP-acid ligase II
MYHGTGGALAASMMMNGITFCIGKRFSTSKFWGEVHDSRAKWITYVGETARYLLAAPPSPLDKDHHVRGMYGNGLRPDVWIRFRERFGVPEVGEFFNSSEGVFGLVNYCNGDYLAGCVGHHGAISRFLNRNTMVPVLIDQATGAIVRDPKTGFALRQPYETGGEIIVAVPDVSVFAGYYKNPEATMKKFERDVFQKGDLWYRSGDALRRTGDGRWFFLDRLGDTFRWKGENVSTAEVADVLGRFPGVVEANVYGVALPAHDGRAGCAAVYIDPNLRKDFDYAGLLKYVSSYPPFIPLLSLSSKTLRRRRQARTYPPPPLRRPHLPTHRAGNDTDP